MGCRTEVNSWIVQLIRVKLILSTWHSMTNIHFLHKKYIHCPTEMSNSYICLSLIQIVLMFCIALPEKCMCRLRAINTVWHHFIWINSWGVWIGKYLFPQLIPQLIMYNKHVFLTAWELKTFVSLTLHLGWKSKEML